MSEQTVSVEDRVKDALDRLGNSVEEIAENLRERGVKGIPRHGGKCAIAQYLQDEINEGWRFSFYIDEVTAYSENFPSLANERVVTSIDPDSPPANFAASYDRGNFPELEV